MLGVSNARKSKLTMIFGAVKIFCTFLWHEKEGNPRSAYAQQSGKIILGILINHFSAISFLRYQNCSCSHIFGWVREDFYRPTIFDLVIHLQYHFI